MANRQYVGARYVPKFADPVEWNSALSYEGLTIVTHLGSSFTSKKPVPAGVDIGNTEYWVNTGNYNEQLEEYKNEVVQLQKQVGIMPVLNVKNYGAVGDGVENDAPRFIAAINDAGVGQTIYIPYGTYKLDDIIPTSKNIIWEIATGSTFTGVGAGNPDTWNGLFASPLNNKGNVVSGKKGVYNVSNITSPLSNGVCAICEELSNDTGLDYINVTGSIDSGSSELKVSSTTGIAIGDGVLLVSPTNPAWPDGKLPNYTMRVRSISDNVITIGKDSGGGRTDEPFIWNGDSIVNGQFKIRKRRWSVLHYQGTSSGEIDNPDKVFYIYNSTANVSGSPCVNMELDLNMLGNPSQESIALLMTGAGNGDGKATGLVIKRESEKNWEYGENIRNSKTGITVNAKTPVNIETQFYDVESDNVSTIPVGIQFDNFIDTNGVHNSLLIGKQLVNGANAITIARAQDNSPTGSFLYCCASDGVTPVATIRSNGSIGCASIDTAGIVYTGQTITGGKAETEAYLPITVGGQIKYIKLYE